MKAKKIILILFLFIYPSALFVACSNGSGEEKRMVILIGDGMGFEQIKAAEYYNGKEFSLKNKSIYAGSVTTLNYSGDVTDSAAGATAMATGQKVSNGVLSRRIPGDSGNIETVFEYAKSKGYTVGLVTTSFIIDATPAAFVSHSDSRSDYAEISDYYFSFKPDLIIGGLKYLTISDFRSNNYSSYNSLEEYDGDILSKIFISISDGLVPYEYDSYAASGTLPHYLSRAVGISENYFKNENVFVMMIEGGRIDHAGHIGSIEKNIFETNEFFDSAESIYNWLAERGDYLMIITADHETGGLNVLSDNGAGIFPDVEWTAVTATAGIYTHSGRPVPVYIYSDTFAAENVNLADDNTEIYSVMKSFIDN